MGQWGRAYLRPRETDIGRIRTLICGENTNALARFALRGELVHIANYPPAWPFHRFRADAHNYNLTEAIRIRPASYAFEGKVFNWARPVLSTPMPSINSRGRFQDQGIIAIGTCAGVHVRRAEWRTAC